MFFSFDIMRSLHSTESKLKSKPNNAIKLKPYVRLDVTLFVEGFQTVDVPTGRWWCCIRRALISFNRSPWVISPSVSSWKAKMNVIWLADWNSSCKLDQPPLADFLLVNSAADPNSLCPLDDLLESRMKTNNVIDLSLESYHPTTKATLVFLIKHKRVRNELNDLSFQWKSLLLFEIVLLWTNDWTRTTYSQPGNHFSGSEFIMLH